MCLFLMSLCRPDWYSDVTTVFNWQLRPQQHITQPRDERDEPDGHLLAHPPLRQMFAHSKRHELQEVVDVVVGEAGRVRSIEHFCAEIGVELPRIATRATRRLEGMLISVF